MPKIKNSANKDQYEELNGPALNAQKEEEMSTLQKISGTLRRLFVSEKKVPPQISDAVVAGTYFQVPLPRRRLPTLSTSSCSIPYSRGPTPRYIPSSSPS